MDEKPMDIVKVFKALSDPKRLKIVQMLGNGELSATVILGEFNITQPTLSHDMRVLCDSGIVTSRREGKKMYYSVNKEYLWAVAKDVAQLVR